MSRTTLRRRVALALLAVGAAVAGLPATTSATAATPQPSAAGASQPSSWNDGKHDQDTIINCPTGRPGVGMSAETGWGSLDGEVPEVGEIFYVRGYIGAVSLPCSGGTVVLPEIVRPDGLEFADDVEPILWSLGRIGEPQRFSTEKLTFNRGRHGGFLIGTPDDEPWTLRQGQLLEIQIPVYATRPMKGPASRQPECQDRVDGDAPCPVAESGDHFQFAFTLDGSGSDRHYVIPYVGLFAAAGGHGPGPVDPDQPTGPTGPTTPATPAASATRARYQVSARRPGRAVVVVRSAKAPAGPVVVRDGGRVVGRGTVGASGRTTVRLPRLTRGVHRMSVRYAGSRTVRPSASVVTRVRVR